MTIEATIVQLRKTYNIIKDLSEEFSKRRYSLWTISAFTIFYNHILDVLEELFRSDGIEIYNKEEVIMAAASSGIIHNVELWLYLLEKIAQAKSLSEEKVLQKMLLVLPSFKNDLLQVVKVLELRLILGMQMCSHKVEEE